MDFQLSEVHQQVQQTAREFAEKEVAPSAGAWDREAKLSKDVLRKVGELGFWGIRIDESYGGAGLDTLAYAIIVEEIARADGSLALTVASHNGLGTSHLMTFGSEMLRARYLPKLATGEMLGAWALTEPGSGSDAAALETRAVRDGDSWVLNGTKMFITQGDIGGVCVVLASTDKSAGAKGITAFAVDRDTPGYSVSGHIRKYGVRASDTAEVVLENVRVADTQRIGEVGHGFVDALKILDRGRVSIAAMALGLGEGALAAALKYAGEREQFGKPIAQFQAIQWMIADSRAELDAARLLTWRAAWLADHASKDASGKARYGREASMAKLYASEAATRACNRALQIHGGYGLTEEFPVERHLRDAKLCEIGEGTSQVQKMVIARDILA